MVSIYVQVRHIHVTLFHIAEVRNFYSILSFKNIFGRSAFYTFIDYLKFSKGPVFTVSMDIYNVVN